MASSSPPDSISNIFHFGTSLSLFASTHPAILIKIERGRETEVFILGWRIIIINQ